jgi:molybdopterin-guanine dinucleotide biosynthesis protein A
MWRIRSRCTCATANVGPVFDAIVLAGGTARRLGGTAKPQLAVGGRTLLDRAVLAVSAARRVVVVGPPQPVTGEVTFCREDPPAGGPVAAIAAGLPLTAADVVVVLAADLPWIAPAVPALLAALPASGVALLVDGTGRPNHLAAAWRRPDLVRALDAVGAPAGAPVRALVDAVDQVHVPDPDGWGRDCDTWEDLADARALGEDR